MSNVLIEKNKIDILANAISAKSGEPVTMTLDEMVEAVDGIETGGGEPNLQAKTYNVSSAGIDTVTADSGYDGLSEVEVNVQTATYYNSVNVAPSNIEWNWYVDEDTGSVDATLSGAGTVDDFIQTAGYATTADTFNGSLYANDNYQLSTQSATTITPTESSQTAVAKGKFTTGAVTVGAISSTYVGTGIDRRDSTNLSTSGATVTAPAGYYASQATKTVTSGTAGTPTATKGTVSNHSVSVTPSVTNSTGYITGSTITGTAVTVSASELVSGSETKTANGTYDVTNLAQLVVNVSGGGSSNFTLLGTKSVGTISTSSTTDTDTGQTIVLTGWNDYDLLVCECSVNTKTNGRHAESTRLAWLTASSTVATKDGCTFATATHNTKLSSSGTATTRSSTTPYGVYAKAGTISGSNLTLTIYRRYNSTQTGTINGSYTMRVYGCKIYDLIGG